VKGVDLENVKSARAENLKLGRKTSESLENRGKRTHGLGVRFWIPIICKYLQEYDSDSTSRGVMIRK
jgi:hypothetical protein